MRSNTIVAVLVGIIVLAGTAQAQSLADIARKEAERRKTVAAPAKVYTDADLRKVVTTPPPEPPPADAAKTDESAAKPADAQAAPVKAGDAAAAGKTVEPSVDLGEEYWRKLIDDARGALAKSKVYLEALEARVRTLTAQFYSTEDVAQRGVVSAQRSKALEDLDQLKKDMAEQEKAIAQIEADARKAGVPPGWIR